MDSQDQPIKESTLEQPAEVEQTPETIEINGENVSIDELKQGYMRQSDYTRKTQELAAKRKELDGEKTSFVRNSSKAAEEELDPEVKEAAELLKKAGFVTKEELSLIEKKQSDEFHLQKLLDANPDLHGKEEAIRAIGKTDNRAWEDIIAHYGFKDQSKIAKARDSRDVKGMPASKSPEAPKSISSMTDAEYLEWKKANMKGQMF